MIMSTNMQNITGSIQVNTIDYFSQIEVVYVVG